MIQYDLHRHTLKPIVTHASTTITDAVSMTILFTRRTNVHVIQAKVERVATLLPPPQHNRTGEKRKVQHYRKQILNFMKFWKKNESKKKINEILRNFARPSLSPQSIAKTISST